MRLAFSPQSDPALPAAQPLPGSQAPPKQRSGGAAVTASGILAAALMGAACIGTATIALTFDVLMAVSGVVRPVMLYVFAAFMLVVLLSCLLRPAE